MHRFAIQRKIRDTLLGATYECKFNAPPAPAQPTLIDPRRPRSLPTTQRPRASIVLKCSSLTTRKRLEERLSRDQVPTTIDDTIRERDVVARLIASGGHDHVLQCYDQFTTQNEAAQNECVCIVMEYCNGGDLCSYVAASRAGLSERESVSITIQVAQGVSFLQTRLGLAHRDLSLENVFLRDGVCKVADFGLATPLNEQCYDRVGKRPYMAPEVVSVQVEGYDPGAADVWSLGVMLFMLLTGSPLVDVASPEDPRFQALTRYGVGAILSAWGFEVSRSLVDLLGMMLGVDPTQRPTVSQIIATLTANP